MSSVTKVVDWILDKTAFLHTPLETGVYKLKDNIFLNHARAEAKGLELLGNSVLQPVRYLLNGKKVTKISPQEFKYELSCQYTKDSKRTEVIKTILAVISLPIVLLLGGAIKGLSFLSKNVREAHRLIREDLASCKTHPTQVAYKEAGVGELFSTQVLYSKEIPAPELTKNQQLLVNAVHDIAEILESAHIPYWISCGTLLGCYRHGKMIPWDTDVDMAIPDVEHQNALRVLSNKLDPKKYRVMDWSGCRRPGSYLRILIKEPNVHLDLYHHHIDEKAQTATYVYTLAESPFIPASCKVRETVQEVPCPLNALFPLKKASFHGVPVRVPSNWETYLQTLYGKDLSPCKIWDPSTKSYKKVEGHPYWNNHDW